MLPTEKKHYTRREEQPLPLPQPSKIIVDCLFCQQLLDSGLGTKRKSNNDGKGFRLDKLLNHIQGCHKDVIMDDNARTLFDFGFSRARVGSAGLAQGGEARDGHSDGPTAIGTHDGGAWEEHHHQHQHQEEQQQPQDSAFLMLPLKWMML